jgi:hypothetical protein
MFKEEKIKKARELTTMVSLRTGFSGLNFKSALIPSALQHVKHDANVRSHQCM